MRIVDIISSFSGAEKAADPAADQRLLVNDGIMRNMYVANNTHPEIIHQPGIVAPRLGMGAVQQSGAEVPTVTDIASSAEHLGTVVDLAARRGGMGGAAMSPIIEQMPPTPEARQVA